jgi:Zn-dependent oligopeptidase
MEKELNFDADATKPYFPVTHVVQKTLEIYQALLGVRFEELADAEKWHEDVRAFAVWDAPPASSAASDAEEGAFLGYCYLDLYPRCKHRRSGCR